MVINPTIALAAGAMALVSLPYALPSGVVVERTATIAADPEAVYGILASNRGFQTINPWKDADPDLRITLQGPESGVGSAFAFEGAEGAGVQTIVAAEPGRRVVTEIDLGRMGKPVQTFTIEPDDDGARVVWSTEARFGMNPIGRVFGLFMEGRLGPVYERGLANLADAV